MSKQVLDSIEFDNSGDGGSVTESYSASIQTEAEFSDETEAIVASSTPECWTPMPTPRLRRS